MRNNCVYLKSLEQNSNLNKGEIMKYLSTDQNHQNETTVYWFDKDGEIFGVAECCGELALLDCDGCEIEDNHTNKGEFFNAVTDEIRMYY